MEQTPGGKKKRLVRVDRITLKSDSLTRIDLWMAELQRRFKGIRITRSELVTWLIGRHSPHLCNSEFRSLQEAYYDEIHFTRWALNELKSAHARGDKLSLKDILSRSKSSEAVTNNVAKTSRPPADAAPHKN